MPHVAAGGDHRRRAFVIALVTGFSETGVEGGALLVGRRAVGLAAEPALPRRRQGRPRARRARTAHARYFDEHGRWPDEERGPDAPLNT